jgi:hypothetical protein
MAKAKAKFAEPVNPPLESVTIEFSPEEAQYLVDLLGTVGGVGKFRALNDSINSELRAASKLNFTPLLSEEFPFERPTRIYTKNPD